MKKFNNVIILLGPPGSGKGTQSANILKNFNFLSLTMGDIIRKEISNKSELGLEMKQVLSLGNLVSDDLIIKIVEKHLFSADDNCNLLLDGFPRTLSQLQSFSEFNLSIKNMFVFLIDVSDDILIDRLISRKRNDDKLDIIKNRLQIYHNEIQPILDFFKNQVIKIDGNHSEDHVYNLISSHLKIYT